MKVKTKHTVKFVRKKRVYLKVSKNLYPFFWIEFIQDGSFSIGIISNEIRFTEYGSAIQRKVKFVDHAQTLKRGDISINEAKAPHYTFHPPKIHQYAGIVHMVDTNGKIDEWELDWFPVNKTQHILSLLSGRIEKLGMTERAKRNFSIIHVPQGLHSIRMHMSVSPKRSRVILDRMAIDNIIGGCRHYNLICRFYKDSNEELCFYVANEM